VKGWRSKFIFLFIVYFAGFASAIYTLAPAPEKEIGQVNEKGLINSSFDSEQFIASFNTGMHKCVDFGKEAALRTAKFIKDKIREKQLQAEREV
jgi:hypothetical protein